MGNMIRVTAHFGYRRALDARKRTIFVVCAINGNNERIEAIRADAGSARGECTYLERRNFGG